MVALVIAFLFDLIYTIPVCMIAYGVLTPFLGIPEKSSTPMLVLMLLMAAITGFRHIARQYRFFIPGLLLVGTVLRIFSVDEIDRPAYLEKNLYLVWILLLVLLGYGLARVISAFTMVKRITLVALLGGAVALMVTGVEIGKMPVAFALFLMLVIVAEEVQAHWPKLGASEPKLHLVSIVPFLMLVALLVYRMPAPEKPYDWAFAVNLWQKASDFLEQITFKIKFRSEEYGTIGFNPSGDMPSKLGDNSEEVMLYTARGAAPEVIYLVGSYLESFDGRRWTSNEEETDRVRMLDTFELMCAIYKKDAKYTVDYYQSLYTRLESRFHNTHFVFFLPKTFLTEETLGELVLEEHWNNVKTKHIIPYKAEYKLSSLWLNQYTDLFAELLLTAEPISAEDWGRFLTTKRLVAEGDLSYEHYLAYVSKLHELYTEQVVLSEEVEALVLQVCSNATNDLERLKCLEEWLRTMTYSRYVEALPEEIDSSEEYLDYFLLESQEGYCTHYATAFTLLARAMGYPVRMAQGYYFVRNGADNVMVTSSMAHAWPEVYFENVGWISFEPTPGYQKNEGWALRSRETGTGQGGGQSQYIPFEIIPTPDKQSTTTEQKEEEPFQWKTLLYPAVGSVGFVFAYLILALLYEKLRYRKMNTEQKLSYLCRKNQRLLRILGMKRRPNETIAEFAERIRPVVSAQVLASLSEQERLLYANGCSENGLLTVKEAHTELLQRAVKKHLWYRLFRLYY